MTKPQLKSSAYQKFIDEARRTMLPMKDRIYQYVCKRSKEAFEISDSTIFPTYRQISSALEIDFRTVHRIVQGLEDSGKVTIIRGQVHRVAANNP